MPNSTHRYGWSATTCAPYYEGQSGESRTMEKTVIDWFEQLRGLDAVQVGEAIFSDLRNHRAYDVKSLHTL